MKVWFGTVFDNDDGWMDGYDRFDYKAICLV